MSGNGTRISIVEDDRAIAAELKLLLEQWGYEASCVEDFRAVSEEIESYEPRLILMDVGLPYYNGYYWCSEIRRFSTVPIVFLSSASDAMNIVMAMDMGGDDFIAKPFDAAVLMAKLRIRDTGAGIPPEDLPRIFEKGYTGANGRRDKRASGIGLYLCRRICDKLGLGLRCESVLHEGTSMVIELGKCDRTVSE